MNDDAKSYAGGSKANYKADQSNSSHSNFDTTKFSHAPKIAQLLRSYHGSVGLLDDQVVFDQCTIRWNQVVLLVITPRAQLW